MSRMWPERAKTVARLMVCRSDSDVDLVVMESTAQPEPRRRCCRSAAISSDWKMERATVSRADSLARAAAPTRD